jgi:ABC-type sugar transport system permease subunit
LTLPRSSSLLARANRRIDALSDNRFAVLSFLPGALLLGLVVIPPIAAVLVMSFMRIELLRDGETRFVGLSNYLIRLAGDAEFWTSVPRTLALGFGVVVLTVPLALACALLMNRVSRFSWLIGIAILTPWAVAPVVTGLYWKFIFNSQYGIATAFLNAIGLADGSIDWLGRPNSAMTIAVIATAWRMVPLMALLLLGILKTIPESLYRAAKMDGAGPFASFRLITLPALRPTLLVVGVMSVVFSLQSIDILFTLTGGGPARSTTVITFYLYQTAIGQLSFGYSAALAMVLLFLIALFSSLLLLTQSRKRKTVVPATELSEVNLEAVSAVSSWSVESSAKQRPSKRRRARRWTTWLLRGATVTGAGLLLIWLIGPVIWIVTASLQPEPNVTTLPLQLSPSLQFSNYIELFAKPAWQQALFVSLQLVILVTIFTMLISLLAAYPLAWYRIPGGKYIIGGLVSTQMIPAIVLVIPILLTFGFIGLKDTVAALVIANVAFWIPLIVWLLRNVFMNVPRSLESAARMDGASRMGALFKVVVPAALPGMVTTAILILVGTWNEFLFAVTLGDRRAVTVTRVMGFIGFSSAGPDGPPPVTILAAAGVAALLPVLLLVIFFYRRLITGLAGGYIKA